MVARLTDEECREGEPDDDERDAEIEWLGAEAVARGDPPASGTEIAPGM
jgi:hypothetical protein